MARRRKYKRRKKDTLLSKLTGRLARAAFSIIVLTAFVLGIGYFVKQASSVNADKVVSFTSPYLSKLGIQINKKELGQVAGELISRVTDVSIESTDYVDPERSESTKDGTDVERNENLLDGSYSERSDGELLFSLALISDSHIAQDKAEYIKNKDYLKQALRISEEEDVSRVIHLGDLTNLGVQRNLQEVKDILDESKLSYYTLPGDRDLHTSVGLENFLSVFDETNRLFSVEDVKFILFDNSANYTEIPEEDMIWFEDNVKDVDYVILSQPLYTDNLTWFNYLYMGSTEEIPADEALAQRQVLVKTQRDRLLSAIRNSNVKAVFAGDHHNSSSLEDPNRKSLTHYVVGAVGETVGEYSDLQDIIKEVLKPKLSILRVYDNGNYSVEEILLKEME